MVHRRARLQGVLKVKVRVKGHVIRTLFWLHENRFFYHKHDWIATKLTNDGRRTGLHPGCAQGQGQGQRSRDTDNFVISRKSLILASKWLDRDQTCTRAMVSSRARIQDVLKVKVKVEGHVIRALLWCHEMFTIQYLLTFSLSMHSLYEAPLRSPSSTSVRQLDVMSTSWNELVRHWRSVLFTIRAIVVALTNQNAREYSSAKWRWIRKRRDVS